MDGQEEFAKTQQVTAGPDGDRTNAHNRDSVPFRRG
jgi:hypothetical protein